MTQLDVPNISFTHYLDLLKRRTWHVVIVSVLGLVVGGMVAMLIPRYYVAQTTVQINRPILDSKLGTPEDPMAEVVNAAIFMVPGGVQEALTELGWPEALSGDPEDRRTFTEAVKLRVGVHDTGLPNKGRRLANLLIRYADTDADRAMEMCNKLLELWLEKSVEGLEQKAEHEIQAVIRVRRAVQSNVMQARSAVKEFEEANEIDPQNWMDPRSGGLTSVLSRDIHEAEANIKLTIREITLKELRLAQRRAELDLLDPTLPLDLANRFGDPALRQRWSSASLLALHYKNMLSKIKPAHPEWKAAKLSLESTRKHIAELERIAGGADPQKANPRFREAEQAVEELEFRLLELQATKTQFEAELQELKEHRRSLGGVYREYAVLRGYLEQLLAQLRLHDDELNKKQLTMSRIRAETERPYLVMEWAYKPPRPTEPSPVLLALMGCIVGLAVALALVLLIDFLQMTFKSIGDVEAALGLPVLGTLTYLETAEERRTVRGRRTRLTVFGVTFLVLLLTVVTIYYVSPTSLPHIVTEILDQILKEPR